RTNMSSREFESPLGDTAPGHSKRLSESAPAALAGTTVETIDGDPQFVDQRRPSVAKGSKSMMKALKKTANKANPLQFIQKSPPKALPALDDDQTPKPKKSLWRMSQAPRQHQLVTDESEDAVLASIEQRGANTKRFADGFRPAVPGETPPLGIPTLGNALQPPALKRTEKLHLMQLGRQKSSKQLKWEGKHRRAKTLLVSIEHSPSERDSGGFGLRHENDHFGYLDELYTNDESLKDSTDVTDDDNTMTDDEKDGEQEQEDEGLDAGESLPLLRRDAIDYGNGPTISERQLKARKVLKRGHLNRLRDFLNPKKVLQFMFQYIVHSTLPICIPLFVIAWILFYYCGNPPPPDFLPGTATLSWWFNFTGER
ncbi:MAG: hypothetical protein SGILL_008487, partial [Bacillariaceae sp.]